MTATSDPPANAERVLVYPPKAGAPSGWRTYLTALGPGLVTGASDDDPSGIATYAQAGAQFGLGFAWTALLTFPLMATVQEICDRTALVTGKGLGELATSRFTSRGRLVVGFLMSALIAANALNIAADLVAVGAGMQLLHAGPQTIWAPLAGLTVSAVVLMGKFPLIAKIFKVLAASLLAYVAVAFINRQAIGVLAHAVFVPHLSLTRTDLGLLIAILGTTISPYLFFWQSAHRLEELRDEPLGGNSAVRLHDRTESDSRHKQRLSRVDVFVIPSPADTRNSSSRLDSSDPECSRSQFSLAFWLSAPASTGLPPRHS